MKLLIFTAITLVSLSQITAFSGAYSSNKQFTLRYEWNQLEFGFPNDEARKQAEFNGNLIPENAILIDVQPDLRGKRTFVTIPKFQEGIPYSLATVSEEMSINGPVLQPYPNYEWHNKENDCDAITSAFRVVITECNQMWVIDSGSVSFESLCPPQLLLFDLETDEIMHRYRFNTSLYTPDASLFVNPLVVVQNPAPYGDCSKTMIYVADVTYHGLVVYDYEHNSAWRIENRYMYPDPNYGLHTVAGEDFILMDGLFSLATDKINLYFHTLASATEYFVPLNVINNSTLFLHNIENRSSDFKVLGHRTGECTVSAMDEKQNLYCVNLNPVQLTKWNVNTPYDQQNIKYLNVDPKLLEFVSGMKIVKNSRGLEELWMLSNRFQKFATGTQTINEVNYRIVVLNLFETAPDSSLEIVIKEYDDFDAFAYYYAKGKKEQIV